MGVRVDLTTGICLIYLKWLLKGAVKVLLFIRSLIQRKHTAKVVYRVWLFIDK